MCLVPSYLECFVLDFLFLFASEGVRETLPISRLASCSCIVPGTNRMRAVNEPQHFVSRKEAKRAGETAHDLLCSEPQSPSFLWAPC